MIEYDHVVYVVDDDRRIRDSICDLLASLGTKVWAFESAADYLAFARYDAPACLLLDVELSDINGLEFQKQISEADHPPIVFITGYGDIPSSVGAMKRGAVDFLTKPFDEDVLLDAIRAAIARDHEARGQAAELARLRRRFDTLTPREQEVLPLLISGLLNKQAATKLGISAVTLQIHRGRIMRKMAAASLADLVRVASRLGIPVTYSRRAE
jgi:FixJ family two-component response regulator